MEARNITIVNSRTQQKTIVNTAAETLGELKAALNAKGINYNGLSFFEGISKTELKDDAAILPHDLPWKGQKTNNLVFMLTEPQKKIRNGAGVASRTEAYAYIKENGLGAEVEKKLGSNFTRCKTPELIDFCNSHSKKSSKAAAKPAAPAKAAAKPVAKKAATATVKKEEVPSVAPARRGRPCKAGNEVALPAEAAQPVAETPVTHEAISQYVSYEGLIRLLIAKGVISESEATTGSVEAPVDVEFSQSELDSMFKGVR